MAPGKHISCGPCSFDDVTVDAARWCSNCEEGLCKDCEKSHRKSKPTRNHKVITIEDYRKIEHVSISLVCEQHGENLEWFCTSHDEVLCVVCVRSKHKACSDVVPVTIHSENSRQSSALSDIEETIKAILHNVQHCIKNRKSATKELKKQALDIKTMVRETRTKINEHLDKLQDNLLQELQSTTHTCKSKYKKLTKKLKSTEELLTKLREQTIHMKQFSSDIQVFLGMRQVSKQIVLEIESIKSTIGAAKDYALKVSIDSIIKKIPNEIEEFGNILLSESTTNLDFRDPKFKQAQIGINISTSRNIFNRKLQLITSIQMKGTTELNVTGCVILPNGNLLMANNTRETKLIEYSDTGKHIRDIQVSGKPFDIAVIDPHRIVVTYECKALLEIMNCSTFNVEKKFNLQKSCCGVSHEDGKLYVANGNSILVIDLSGKEMKTLKALSQNIVYIKSSRDKIFYTDCNTYKVHCCRLNGEEIWQYGIDSINFPGGITIDICHNIYVLGFISNNLTIIQHDGKDSKTLLTKSDGLNFPRAVDFDKDTKTLCICNQGGKVALYKVV